MVLCEIFIKLLGKFRFPCRCTARYLERKGQAAEVLRMVTRTMKRDEHQGWSAYTRVLTHETFIRQYPSFRPSHSSAVSQAAIDQQEDPFSKYVYNTE